MSTPEQVARIPATTRRLELWNRWKGTPRLSRILTYAALIVLAFIFLTPIFWMVTTAVKEPSDIRLSSPVWIPSPVRLANFSDAWSAAPFWTYLKNSVIVTGAAMVGQVVSCVVVAYGFAMFRFPFRNVLFGVMLATLMLPDIVVLLPNFVLFQKLGWIDTFWPLIVPAWFASGQGAFAVSAFFIFFLRQSFRSIPRSYIEAAELDGASPLRVLWNVVIPMSKPAIATLLVLSFVDKWNDFTGPLIYLTSQDHYTLNLGVRTFMEQHSVDYGLLMAIGVLIALPVMVLFAVAQRSFVRGLTVGGIKR